MARRVTVLLACAVSSTCGGLYGHGWPYEGFSTAGFVQDGGGGVSWTKDGSFGMQGNMRMYLVEDYQVTDWWGAKFVTFNLLGKTLTYTVDLSKVPCGVIACLYFTANWKPGPGSNYCDIQQQAGGCFEMDLMEANSVAFESSLHVQTGNGFDGSCNEKGCSLNMGRYPFTRDGARTKDLYGPGGHIDSRYPFDVRVDVDNAGYMSVTLSQGDKVFPFYNQSSAGNLPDIPWNNFQKPELYPKPAGIPADAAAKTVAAMSSGIRLVASMWQAYDTRWLDQSGCGNSPHGDLNSAVAIFSGLKVTPLSGPVPGPKPEPEIETVVANGLTPRPTTTTATTTAEPTATGPQDCTAAGQDPNKLGHLKPCCAGLSKQLKNWDKADPNRWFYLCLEPGVVLQTQLKYAPHAIAHAEAVGSWLVLAGACTVVAGVLALAAQRTVFGRKRLLDSRTVASFVVLQAGSLLHMDGEEEEEALE